VSRPPPDSRFYSFAFAITEAGEIPGDFAVPEWLGPLRCGLFLPRDDPDWFGRSAYPPRVMLLADDEMAVLPHPCSGQSVLRIPLGEIGLIEAGHVLLLGWIRLRWASGEAKFPYNTRTKQPVHRFVQELTKACMPPAAPRRETAREWGAPLDVKFSYALRRALGAEESVLARLFVPAERTVRRRLLLRFRSWRGAHLIALTTRRALWITDQCEGMYERYGSTALAVPLARLRDVAGEAGPPVGHLDLRFEGAGRWRIPVPIAYEAAVRGFAADAAEIASELRPASRG
jgi:hypothetical protein